MNFILKTFGVILLVLIAMQALGTHGDAVQGFAASHAPKTSISINDCIGAKIESALDLGNGAFSQPTSKMLTSGSNPKVRF